MSKNGKFSKATKMWCAGWSMGKYGVKDKAEPETTRDLLRLLVGYRIGSIEAIHYESWRQDVLTDFPEKTFEILRVFQTPKFSNLVERRFS